MPTSTSRRGVRCPRQSGPTSSGRRFRPAAPRLRRRKESRSRWLTDAARSRPRRPPPGRRRPLLPVRRHRTVRTSGYTRPHRRTAATPGFRRRWRARARVAGRRPQPFGETAKPAGFGVGLLVATLGFADDTNSAAGISGKARTNASKPLPGNIFPTPTTRCSPLRAACGPFGVNALPHVRLPESAGAQNVRATAVRNLDSPDSHSG